MHDQNMYIAYQSTSTVTGKYSEMLYIRFESRKLTISWYESRNNSESEGQVTRLSKSLDRDVPRSIAA